MYNLWSAHPSNLGFKIINQNEMIRVVNPSRKQYDGAAQLKALCWEQYIKYSSLILDGHFHDSVGYVKRFDILAAEPKMAF